MITLFFIMLKYKITVLIKFQLLSSFREIIKDEGVSGLWNGLMPRLTGEILRIWLAGSVAFVINNYAVQEASVRSNITPETENSELAVKSAA